MIEVVDDRASLNLRFSEPWIAENKASLYQLIRSDVQLWLKFDFLRSRVEENGLNISLNLYNFAEKDPPKGFDPSFATHILPNIQSDEGDYLFKLIQRNEAGLAADLIFAFFVENDWLSNPFDGNLTNGNRLRDGGAVKSYVRGISLLAGSSGSRLDQRSHDDWESFNLSLADAKSKLAQLKSQITRRDNELAGVLDAANASVTQLAHDRGQIRSIAASGHRIALARFSKDKDRWNAKFSNVYDHFTKQLEYKAAVELWGARAVKHRTDAHGTWCWLGALGSCFIILIILTVVFLGDDIADSFVSSSCNSEGVCAEGWSAKGPLTIGSILLISSLVLWLLRTLNKFYLSARHLASDAEERKAFVQTYLALREDDTVNEKHEAIVLSALFRPTQDGVVTDDSSPLDPSIVSLLSRRMGS